MGTINFVVDNVGQSWGGTKTISGTMAMSTSYATSGDGLNLANYFDSSKAPFVALGSDDGYLLAQTSGRNAEALLIKAYSVGWYAINANNGSANKALTEVGNGTNLAAVNVPFFATGWSV